MTLIFSQGVLPLLLSPGIYAMLIAVVPLVFIVQLRKGKVAT